MSPTVTTKSFKQEEVVWQQYHLFLAVAEHHILGEIWWFKEVQYLWKKYHCQWTLLRGVLEFLPVLRERVVPTEWQVRTVLGDCISRARVIQCKRHSIGNMR